MLLCTQSDEKFVSRAVDQAFKSELRARLGCVAVSSGKVIAKGCNHNRTYSKDGLIENTCSTHAEIEVLRQCLKLNKIRKISMYIVRISRDGNLLCSAPCKQCLEKMQQFKIKTLTYVNKDGSVIKQNFHDYTTDFETSGKIALLKKRVRVI